MYNRSYSKVRKSFFSISAAAVLTAYMLTGCGGSKELILSGTIESTQMEVNAEISGKVLSVDKEEGSVIDKDDVMATVDSSLQELSVKQQEAVVKLKKSKLSELESGSRAEQLRQAEASVKAARAKLDELREGTRPEQITQAQAALDTAITAVDTAKLNYDYWLDKYNKVKSLYESDKASESELSDAKYKLDSANQQLKTSRDQLTSAEAQLNLLEKGASSQSIKAAEANYEQALAQLDLLKNGATGQAIQAAQADLEQSEAALEQAKLVLSKYKIKSPANGTLILNNATVGDMINVGTSVATVSDLKDLWVKVYIPQKNLDSIKLEQVLELQSPMAGGATIKGKVIYISSEAEFTPKNIETKDAKENTVFKVKVRILDNVDKLKPGGTVEVHIPIATE